MNSTPRFASGFVAFVGKVVIGALVAFAVLELVFWAAWSLGDWIHPDPLRPQVSPAYSGATWVDEFDREQGAEESRFAYFPFYTARRLFSGRRISSNEEQLRAKATTVIDNYEANLNTVRALGQAYTSSSTLSGNPCFSTVINHWFHSSNKSPNWTRPVEVASMPAHS